MTRENDQAPHHHSQKINSLLYVYPCRSQDSANSLSALEDYATFLDWSMVSKAGKYMARLVIWSIMVAFTLSGIANDTILAFKAHLHCYCSFQRSANSDMPTACCEIRFWLSRHN